MSSSQHHPSEPSGSTTTPAARLQPGDPAPDFTLPDADGNPVSLAAYRGRSVVVYFYPAAMTPGCTTQASDFRDNSGELSRAGYDILGISPDPVGKLAEFRTSQHLGFPLLSDADRSVMIRWGAFGSKKLYGKEVTGVIRSTFVVDPDGTITVAQYNVKAAGHVAKLKRELGLG